MSKYKELKIDYDIAISDLDFYKSRYEEVQKNLSWVQSQVNQLLGINNVNADVIQFLAARKFGDNPTIEFAAIKTYRDGWITMFLNGEEIRANGKDVTIWAENNEAVRVEVNGS